MLHNIQGDGTTHKHPCPVGRIDTNLDSILGLRFVSVWNASAAATAAFTHTAPATTNAAVPHHTTDLRSAGAVACAGTA